jgi:predicted methyltransferase
MKKAYTLVSTLLLVASMAAAEHHESIADAIANEHRSDSNRERDGDRNPDQVLSFIDLESGDVVLDWGSGGGYWAELFAAQAGADGKVYAQQRAGERYESRKAALVEQYAPFGNVELLPTATGEAIPLDDNAVDTVMLSYIYHHMHYADGSGEAFPDSSAALVGEFLRVLKPGGTFIVIEHAAVDGSGRAESAAWHRTPPDTATADITGVGFDYAGDAPGIFHNPNDDRMNNWNEAGLRGNTTSFVHKYRKP